MGATFPNEMRPSVVLEAASTWVVNGSILGFSKSFGATGSNPEGMDEPTATSTPDIIQIPSTAACGRCGPSHGGSCASPPPHPYPPAAFPSLPLPLAAAALRMHGGSCASPPPNPSTCCLPHPPPHTWRMSVVRRPSKCPSFTAESTRSRPRPAASSCSFSSWMGGRRREGRLGGMKGRARRTVAVSPYV